MHILNLLKMYFAVSGKNIHRLNVLEVILALIIANGILRSSAFKIKLGQISESTKKIAEGFHKFKNLRIKNSIS